MNEKQTRQRLIEAALEILAAEGLEGDLLPGVAEKINCPLKRAMTFFKTDEELILSIYLRFASDLESILLELPAHSLAQRFKVFVAAKLRLLAPYRDAMRPLMSRLMDPKNELSVFHPQTEIIRAKLMGILSVVVEGSSSKPAKSREDLKKILYLIHVGLVFLWFQDVSPNQIKTYKSLDSVARLMAKMETFLRFPGVGFLLGEISAVLNPILDLSEENKTRETGIAILKKIFLHRRLLSGSEGCAGCQAKPCSQCFAFSLGRLKYFILKKQPIHFILPAFPAKSPSRRKTLGPLPDMAEEVGIRYLLEVCREIKEVYAPGARITLCSDGHVFGDLVKVSDTDVENYGQQIKDLLKKMDAHEIDFFSMSDLYEALENSEMRAMLIKDYARPLQEVRQRAHDYAHVASLVNGIHRFVVEEQADVQMSKSRSALQKETRDMAYQVVQRSEAWGRLIADCFPMAVRLSIHPQHPHSEKIGILLGDAKDAWLTPWHSVAVVKDNRWSYMKRHEAEALGGRLVHHENRPSYFEIKGR